MLLWKQPMLELSLFSLINEMYATKITFKAPLFKLLSFLLTHSSDLAGIQFITSLEQRAFVSIINVLRGLP